MNTGIVQKIPDNFKRRLVTCVTKALHDDKYRYLSEFHPDTTNAIPHLIGDWINTNIKNDLQSEGTEIKNFNRSSWAGRIIIDRKLHITYSIMREKRLHQVREETRERPHYLQTILYVHNKEFKASNKQQNLFGEDFYLFDSKIINSDYYSIFNGSLDRNDGFIHCTILYDTTGGELIDIKILLLDKELDIVEDLSLNEYIKPDFAALTNTTQIGEGAESVENKTSDSLLSTKERDSTENNTEDTAVSSALLRDNEKSNTANSYTFSA